MRSYCIFLIVILAMMLVNVQVFAVPEKIIPKMSPFERGWDQGDIGSCYAFAIANAVENHYSRMGYSGITISPWHFFYYQKQNLDYQNLVDLKLTKAYTSSTFSILKRFGQLVPSLFLPEGGQGLDSLHDGNGWLPPIEVFGKYPQIADSPLSYTTESHFMEDYFLPGESLLVSTNRIQSLIAKGAVLTLSLNGDYIEKEFDSTFGTLKTDSDGIRSGKYSERNHSVAIVGYDNNGIIIKNSWNSLSQYLSEKSIWESSKNSLAAWDFKRLHFGHIYQHGYYRIPYEELAFQPLKNKSFLISIHNFNTNEFLNRFLKYQYTYKVIPTYFVCGDAITGLSTTNRVLQMIHDGSSEQKIKAMISKMIEQEVMGEYPTYRYASLPVTRINNSDAFDYNLVYAFYRNTNSALDEFYCPSKGKKMRIPWRSTEQQANILYKGMSQLSKANSIDQQTEIWFQILPEMFNERR